MRTEIEQLQTRQRQSERIIAALVSNERSEHILEQLRSGETIEAVSENLDKGKQRNMESGSGIPDSGSGDNVTTYNQPSEFHAVGSALKSARNLVSSPLPSLAFSDTYGDSQPLQDPGSWPAWGRTEGSTSNQSSTQGQHDDLMRWSPETSSLQHGPDPLVGTWHQQLGSEPDSTTIHMMEKGRETILGQEFAPDEHPQAGYTDLWTKVTSDDALVEHLMALYFCWEYPTFASLSKEHFLEDYRLGRRRHCSELLVNAMLAVGCRFSTQAATRTDPSNSNTAGDHFFAEASRLLLQESDRHNLTTVQALGLMSIREASCGRSSEGIYYSGQSIRLAIEMGLHQESESGGGDNASLEHAVRSATFWGAFSLDQCWSLCIGKLPQFSRDTNLIAKPSIVDHIEASPWIPYTDDGAPLHQLGTQPSNVRSVYKTFCELSEIVHRAHYTLYTPGNKLTATSLIDIYTRYLKWYDSIPVALRLGQNFTPSVLFAHMYYHFSILLLFRPFIKLEIVGSGVSPRDVCSQAADAIMALTNSYSQLYTLRRTPSFVPYFVMAASIAHLVTLGTGRGGPESLHQGVADLKTMAACHGSAIRARDILKFLAVQWEIEVIIDDEDGEDLTMVCKPQTTSFNQFCPNIDSSDMKSTIKPLQSEEENPLFWPFPMQGRPLLGIGEELKHAGFRILTVLD